MAEIVDLVKRVIEHNGSAKTATLPDHARVQHKMARRAAVRELKDKGLTYRQMGNMIGVPYHEVHHWLIWPNVPRGRQR